MQDVMVAYYACRSQALTLVSRVSRRSTAMAAGFDRYSQVMQDIEIHEGRL